MKKKSGIFATIMKLGAKLTLGRWGKQLHDIENETIKKYGDKLKMTKALQEGPERQVGIIEYHDFVGWGKPVEEIKQSVKIVPIFTGVIRGAKKSTKITAKNSSISPNPPAVKVGMWEEFEDMSLKLGVGLVGYTKIPRELIFRGMGIISENAVVLAMELEPGPISESPRFESGVETIRVYRDLGYATNSLASFLQRSGFRAQPVHPFGGSVILPLAAAEAGLGYPGLHGLLISKKFGPRQRISIISTNAGDFPPPNKNPMSKIQDFCSTCRVCIKKCPGKAFYDPPLKKGNGFTTTHVDLEKCYPFFARYKSCSVCLKVCAIKLEEAGIVDGSYRYGPS